jgi:hypothetical protein
VPARTFLVVILSFHELDRQFKRLNTSTSALRWRNGKYA